MRHYGRCGRNKAILKKERDENMPKKKKKRHASKTRNMPRGDGECKKMRQHRRAINLLWGRAEKISGETIPIEKFR